MEEMINVHCTQKWSLRCVWLSCRLGSRRRVDGPLGALGSEEAGPETVVGRRPQGEHTLGRCLQDVS